jgi:hypothetical protein
MSSMRIVLILLSIALAFPAVADASSVAYIKDGEVWLSSLDGAQKVRLAEPVVNGSGETEKWLAVAASDGGRIVAARNKPGRIASFSWFKVWEPDGTSTVEGPLNYPGGWQLPVYPLGFDVTADGKHMVYGFSNSSCCPYTFGRGTYVRPVTNSSLAPIPISGYEEPTLFGSQVVAKSGSTVSVQQAAATTYGTDFEPWLDVSGTMLDLRRTDIAATGRLAAFELEQWDNGTQKIGKLGVVSIDAVGGNLTGAVDCILPASGIAKDVSLSQDGGFIAWTDDQGLKVAGTPTTAADPCVPSSPAVVIAAGATSASISGGAITPFLPPAPPVQTPTTTNPTTNTVPSSSTGIMEPATATQPKLPAKVTAKALTTGLQITVGAAGKVTVVVTVGKTKVGTGSATAKGAGKVTVKLKLTKAGRKLARKGKKVTLKVTQAGRSVTKTVKLG